MARTLEGGGGLGGGGGVLNNGCGLGSGGREFALGHERLSHATLCQLICKNARTSQSWLVSNRHSHSLFCALVAFDTHRTLICSGRLRVEVEVRLRLFGCPQSFQ